MEERDILEINNIVQKEHDRKLHKLLLLEIPGVILLALGYGLLMTGIEKILGDDSYIRILAIFIMLSVGLPSVIHINKITSSYIKEREKMRARLIFNKLGGK